MQLAEALEHSDPKVLVETVEVEKEGVCIRYCPLENAQGTLALTSPPFSLQSLTNDETSGNGEDVNAKLIVCTRLISMSVWMGTVSVCVCVPVPEFCVCVCVYFLTGIKKSVCVMICDGTNLSIAIFLAQLM